MGGKYTMQKNGYDEIAVVAECEVPVTIYRYLRDDQREGVKFLCQHYKMGEGAILGDGMGMGKTVQVLAFFIELCLERLVPGKTAQYACQSF
ncbi:DNA excision repair protein ERCC-6-like 2 [Asterias amurensis]|uniref:DNA excision repair protein ERCC-6-like 2 n=1 Tax=Asterias amurensis TaxID=7602 RepID=UPI003AB40B9F